MSKIKLLCACAFPVLVLAAAMPAAAQVGEAAASPQEEATPEIIVTGSLIRGTPEDAALPVDVIGSEELARQGNPSALELLKALPTSSAVLGDSNQYDSRSQGAEGIATANLRGLGPQRTLVLLNSRRLATSGNGVPAVDLNLLPQAALGRIEVLKDGAAATYGSDALAGVVNFITRTNQQGFVASGSYRFVKDTDGDIDASLSYGHQGNGFRMLAAVGFQKRGELAAIDRDFAIRPYNENPQGGWTGGGNPASYLPLGAGGAPVGALGPDPACSSLGGYPGANGRCYTQYTPFVNLVDLEKRGQAFLDVEIDLAADTQFRITTLYGRTTVPHYLTSPSYLLTQRPSSVALGGNPTPFVPGFFVPATNPGFIAYRNAGLIPATATTGAVFPLLLFRPYLSGGNPSTNDDPNQTGAARGMRKSERFRATAELTGKLGDSLNYQLSATYDDYYRYTDGYDAFGDRVQLALRGLGGPNCNYLTGTPGVGGCQFLNPFGNAITSNPQTGATNALPTSLQNSAELTDWFFVRSITKVDTELFVLEGSLSGNLGLTLPGGDVQFGVGGQYRKESFDSTPGANNDLRANPCRESPLNGNTNPAACAPNPGSTVPNTPNGALGFLGTAAGPVRLKGDIWAAFGELQVPILDILNLQLAARFEDYGGEIGSTFDPQARLRLQVTDWLAVRGGMGTTFRGPTLANVEPGRVTALQLIGSTFTPVDVFGNPALKPESATNYSAGVLFDFGGFNASLDYYRYDVTDVIVSDPLGAMVSTLFPGAGGNTCATNPTLAARFTFSNGACTAATTIANVARVRTVFQNGASIRNEGIDFMANYRSNTLFGSEGRFGAGVNVSYVMANRISDIFVEGVLVQPSYDGVGLLNYQSTLYPVPEWKGQAYIDLGFGPADLRIQGNYIDGLYDQRANNTLSGPYGPDASLSGSPRISTGANIQEFVTFDATLQLRLSDMITLTAGVYNIGDKDPPFAREDYNYEPFIGNPLGRTIRVGASTKF